MCIRDSRKSVFGFVLLIKNYAENVEGDRRARRQFDAFSDFDLGFGKSLLFQKLDPSFQ